MKYMYMLLPLVFIGCGTRIEYQTVYKTKTVYLKPSNSILKYKVETPAPPDKNIYVNARPIEREEMLTNYIIDLLGVIKKYEEKDKRLIEWYNINDENKSE